MEPLTVNLKNGQTQVEERVCIPVITDGNSGSLIIARRFHSAEAFLYVDTRENSAVVLSVHEATDLWQKPSNSSINLQRITSIIAQNIAPMAHKILHDKGIAVYKSKGINPETNIDLLLAEKLDVYTDADTSGSGACSSSCSQCSTVCN